MTNAKNTKRALLMSVLSMMLCCAMLIGSTFAWFTDSVTSGKNKIVAGNLDVELYHTNGSISEEQVGADTKLFVNADGSEIKWEPGVMVYENFTVKNVGSLALKYRLTVNAGDFNTVTVDGVEKSLKDVLKVAILDEAFTGDRAAAQALTFDKTVEDFEKDGAIAAGAEDDTYAIVIYWEPSANDNDYNLNNGKESSDGEALFIDLGVNLVATQDTVESDSFGKDYDKGLPLTQAATIDELNKAIFGGGEVLLTSDVDAGTTKGSKIVITGSTTINGNGNTISTKDPDTNAYVSRVIDMDSQSDVALNIVDAVITGGTTSGNNPYLYRGISLYNNTNPVLNIKNSTVNAGHYAINIASSNTNAKINVNNSTVAGYCAFQTHSSGTTATFSNSSISGINQWGGNSSDFAAIVVNSTASGSTLSFNNCAFEVTEQKEAKEIFLSLRADCTVNLNNCTFVKNGEIISKEAIITDIQESTNKYVQYYYRDDVAIYIDGEQVNPSYKS